jgi:hypothetical protein
MAPSPLSFRREQTQVLATSAQKWDARYSHAVPHTNDYYLKCCLGGILSCGLTHLAVTPLDVAKCNMQVRVFFFFLRCNGSEMHPVGRICKKKGLTGLDMHGIR